MFPTSLKIFLHDSEKVPCLLKADTLVWLPVSRSSGGTGGGAQGFRLRPSETAPVAG